MKNRILLLSVLCCFVGVLAPAAAFAEDKFRVGDSLPQVVVDAWQKRRDACRSVYWKLKCRELITAGLVNLHNRADLKEFGPRPKQDEWREEEYETWIDLPALRVRNECRGTMHDAKEDGTTPLIPIHTVHLFDGKSLQKVELHNDNRLMEQDPEGVSQGLVFTSSQMPLFWGLGIVFGPDTPFQAHKLNDRLDPQKFRITAVQRDGDVTHVTVRANINPASEFFVELKIAVERDAAIVGKWLRSKVVLWTETSAEWSQTKLGWQPVSWKENSFHGDNTLATSGEYEVIERSCTPDLSAVAFHFDPRTGTPYLDVKKRTTFVKSPPGQPDVPKELYDIQHAARQRRWNWLVSGAIVLACFGAGVWWWRRRSDVG